MKYLCVYNPESKKILLATEEPDESRLYYTREACRLQALVLGPDWVPYCGDEPFAFPVDKPA
jgi:hypothetical protein